MGAADGHQAILVLRGNLAFCTGFAPPNIEFKAEIRLPWAEKLWDGQLKR